MPIFDPRVSDTKELHTSERTQVPWSKVQVGGLFWNLSKCKQLFISLSPSYTRQDCRSPGIWQQKHRRRTLSGCRRSSKAGWSYLLPPVWGWNDPCWYWRRVFYLTLRCPSTLAGFLLSEEGFCSTIRLSVTVVWYFETQKKIILGGCITIRSLSVTLVCQVECLVRYWQMNKLAKLGYALAISNLKLSVTLSLDRGNC